MKIAIPVSEGSLFPHFGHCQTIAMIDVDETAKRILGRQDIPAPPHEPGKLPDWLAQRGATVIIAGGMGGRAIELCRENGMTVIVGAPTHPVETLAQRYLTGQLQSGPNRCDH